MIENHTFVVHSKSAPKVEIDIQARAAYVLFKTAKIARTVARLGMILGFLCLCASGHAQSSPAGLNERTFDFRGVKYVTAVPNDPPATPAWAPGAGEPPLTAAGALRAADAEYQKLFAATGAFKLKSINLSQQGSGWIYQVVYVQTVEDAKAEMMKARSGMGFGQGLISVIYYVTLDGTVYGPKAKNG